MEIAPLRLRLLAGAIDATLLLGAIGGVVAAVIKLPTPDWSPPDTKRLKRFFESPPARHARWVVGLTLAPVGRNWRSPGARLVGIAKVDARTRGPVTARSAVIGHVASQTLAAASTRAVRSVQQRQQQRLSGDRSSARSCLLALIPIILQHLPTLSTKRHQSAISWLAGTVVVRRR